MKNKYISFFLIIPMLILGLSCQKTETHTHNEESSVSTQRTENSQDLEAASGRKRKRLKIQARGKPQGTEDTIELTEEEKKAIKIKTVKASFKSLNSRLQALGKVFAHPQRKAIVSYAFSARISRVHVQIGAWVTAGQELITLQSEEVGTAKSEFYKAQADHELAKVNFERAKRLFDRGVGAQKNFLVSEAQFKVTEANLNAAEKKLHVLGFTEKHVKSITETHQINPIINLFAPISGKIIENNAILGAMVDQSSEILIIMDPKLLVIDAEIYEKDIAKIQIGQQVEVSVPAYPGKTFSGKISYISDVLKEETRTITVRTEVENKNYELKPGMFANIKIFLNHNAYALVLPIEAILDERNESIVFIKVAGKFKSVIVQTGVREANLIEILSGIKEGDEVVTNGNFQLKSKLYEEILQKGHVH